MRSKAALTAEQQCAATEAVISLDWIPILSPLPARAIAEVLAISEQRAAVILAD